MLHKPCRNSTCKVVTVLISSENQGAYKAVAGKELSWNIGAGSDIRRHKPSHQGFNLVQKATGRKYNLHEILDDCIIVTEQSLPVLMASATERVKHLTAGHPLSLGNAWTTTGSSQ